MRDFTPEEETLLESRGIVLCNGCGNLTPKEDCAEGTDGAYYCRQDCWTDDPNVDCFGPIEPCVEDFAAASLLLKN